MLTLNSVLVFAGRHYRT